MAIPSEIAPWKIFFTHTNRHIPIWRSSHTRFHFTAIRGGFKARRRVFAAGRALNQRAAAGLVELSA